LFPKRIGLRLQSPADGKKVVGGFADPCEMESPGTNTRAVAITEIHGRDAGKSRPIGPIVPIILPTLCIVRNSYD